jgi:hypothetical protein
MPQLSSSTARTRKKEEVEVATMSSAYLRASERQKGGQIG